MLRLGLERVGRAGDEALVEEQFPIALKHYAACLADETRLYPGVADAVQGLLDAGYRTGICTNKPEGLAVDLVARLGVSDLFGSLIGADTLPVRKPDPAPYFRAVADAGGQGVPSTLIGDTVTDRETARRAGVPCVLVTFGPEGEGVSAMNPEALLPGYDQLQAVVGPLLNKL